MDGPYIFSMLLAFSGIFKIINEFSSVFVIEIIKFFFLNTLLAEKGISPGGIRTRCLSFAGRAP